MVAISQEYVPESDTPDVKPKDGGIEVASIIDERIRDGLIKASNWMAQAYQAHRYYRSDQHRQRAASKERNRIRLVANFIRRDVDLITAEILDGKPVVNPVGRHPKHYNLGRQLMQLLEWTRDEEDNWHSDLERVITSCIHIGEGVLFEGWDQYASDGRGCPVAIALDSRYVIWDDGAKELQRDDAQFIIWISYEYVMDIEARYPEIEGMVRPETDDHFLVPSSGRQSERDSTGGTGVLPYSSNRPDSERAWVKRQWEKKAVHETKYIYSDTKAPVTVIGQDGQEEPLTAKLFKLLTPEQKKGIDTRRTRRIELWEAISVNETLISYRLSPFDRSKGGHGRYPFAFFQYEVLPDEHRARGEIGFLRSVQDIMNESVTQMLEQLFLNNVGYWHVFSGSLTPEQRRRFSRIFYEPNQVVESQLGIPPPEHRGVNPSGLQSATASLPIIKDLADKISGIHDVDRGQVPGHIESGRAIRALQAKTSRLNLKIKRHVESGLQRATLLRLHNVLQLMRGPRVFEVTDIASGDNKVLFLGWDEQEVIGYYELVQGQHKDGKTGWTTAEGEEADIIVLNDQVARDAVFEKVRLTLDTGHKSNLLERQEQAEMVLNIVGPAAIPWAAKQLEWSNTEELLDAIEKRDAAVQMMSMAEDFEKETGMSAMEGLQKLMQELKAPTQPQGPGAPTPAPGGPPPPPGQQGAPGPSPVPPGAQATPGGPPSWDEPAMAI